MTDLIVSKKWFLLVAFVLVSSPSNSREFQSSPQSVTAIEHCIRALIGFDSDNVDGTALTTKWRLAHVQSYSLGSIVGVTLLAPSDSDENAVQRGHPQRIECVVRGGSEVVRLFSPEVIGGGRHRYVEFIDKVDDWEALWEQQLRAALETIQESEYQYERYRISREKVELLEPPTTHTFRLLDVIGNDYADDLP